MFLITQKPLRLTPRCVHHRSFQLLFLDGSRGCSLSLFGSTQAGFEGVLTSQEHESDVSKGQIDTYAGLVQYSRRLDLSLQLFDKRGL